MSNRRGAVRKKKEMLKIERKKRRKNSEHTHKFAKVVILLGMLFSYGSIGAIECETISWIQGMVQTIVGMVAAIGGVGWYHCQNIKVDKATRKRRSNRGGEESL